ncbi:hypothetical protein K2X33_14405 [bacterium]|nr:hypothetical protein [bacterium]
MNELTGALPAHLTERPQVSGPKDSMGKEEFMQLLMAQLKHQDPLSPMDQKEFSAQLAQFASLEKLTQIGSGIEKLENGMGEEAKLQALGMIGKHVKAAGAEVTIAEGKPVDIALNTEGGFRPLKVSLYSGDGKLVREMDVDPRTTEKSLKWDGKSTDGDGVPDGIYQFRVSGLGPDGKTRNMDSMTAGKVIGVEMNEKRPMLLLETPNGQTKVEVAKIQSIGTVDPAAAPKAEAAKPEAAKPEAKPAVTALGEKPQPPAAAEAQKPQADSRPMAWGAPVVESPQGWMEYRP